MAGFWHVSTTQRVAQRFLGARAGHSMLEQATCAACQPWLACGFEQSALIREAMSHAEGKRTRPPQLERLQARLTRSSWRLVHSGLRRSPSPRLS